MKNLLTTLIICVVTLQVTSAQLKKWTLQECVEYAMENNQDVALYALDFENARESYF